MTISRRTFLAGASVSTVMAANPVLVRAAPTTLAAKPSTSPTLSTTKVRPTLLGSSLDVGMFKNIALSLVSFQSSAGYAFPAILDENGFPTSTPASNIYGIVKFPSNIVPSTQMVLKWSGTGSVQLGRGAPGFTVVAGASFVSGGTDYNLNVVGSNARVVFAFKTSIPASVSLVFLAGGKFSGFGNLVLCKLSDEAAVDAATTPEALFSDDYVSMYKTLNPGIWRPMGWANPNFGNVSQSRYIAPWKTSINLMSQRWAPGAWAGTSSGTNNYVCGAQKDATKAYVDGEMIHLQFGSANTSKSVTINSGGRGVVPVLSGTGGNTGQQLNIGQITAGSLATLTYDAVLGAFLWQSGGQSGCLPYELQVAFANLISADYWCNFSAYMDDASITAVSQIVRDRLSTGLNAYFEYGNEIWNWGFPATSWAEAKGTALGFPSDNSRRSFGWYALRTRQVMGLVTTTWAPRPSSQLKRVIAFQAFGSVGATNTYKLLGADLNGAAYPKYAARGYTNYNVSPNRPIDYCDILSYATYYSGAQCTNFDANYLGLGAAKIAGLLGAADDFASGVPTKMTSALAFLDNDIRAGKTETGVAGNQTLLALNTGYNGTGIYPAWEAVAKTYNKMIVCYEGGCESWYPSTAICTSMGISTAYGGADGKISKLLDGYKQSDAFATLVRDQFNQFLSFSHSKASAWLIVQGPNQWALSTGDTFAPKYKSWNALSTYSF